QVGLAAPGVDRADVEHGPLRRGQVGAGPLDEQQRGADVDGQDAVEKLGGGGRQVRAGDGGGVVDQGVEAAEGGDGEVDQARAGGRVGQVAAAQGGAGGKLVEQGAAEVLFEAVDDDLRPLGDAASRDGA